MLMAGAPHHEHACVAKLLAASLEVKEAKSDEQAPNEVQGT